jgi:hypothetical protein
MNTAAKETAYLYMVCVLAAALAVLLFVYARHPSGVSLPTLSKKDVVPAARELSNSPFLYTFNEAGTVEEAGSMAETRSPYWWVDSGGLLSVAGGEGSTVQGALAATSTWRQRYAAANPTDTDNGLHPQNIFRLVSRGNWKDLREEMYFKITADNMSASPNRNESNGLLLFARYADSNNLYYAGVRVDGTAVIKKKQAGAYTTLVQVPIIQGKGKYDPVRNPNLLPKNTWVGLRLEVRDTAPGTVSLELYTDVGETGKWTLAASATDDGTKGPPLEAEAHAGVRTDFMDVRFRNYRVERL